MDIKVDNFILKPSEGSPSRWDLYEKKIRKKKESDEEIEFEQIIGYSLQFDTCVKYIIHINLKKNKSVVELKDFIKMYNEEASRITNLIK